MSDASSCVFCAIVAGRLPCHEVLDDGKVKVLMDAFPACDGHVLVIPHAHVENIFELDEQTVRDVAAMVRRVAIALKTTLAPDGLTISQANGSAAGQSCAALSCSSDAPHRWRQIAIPWFGCC